MTTKADYGSRKFDRQIRSTLVYKLGKETSGNLSVSLTAALSTQKGYGYQSHPIFRIGPTRVFSGTMSGMAIIKPNGRMVRVNRPAYWMGLPVDESRLPFPPLLNDAEWTTSETVSLVRSVHNSGYFQLLPVSPSISDPFAAQRKYRHRKNDDLSQQVALSETKTKLVKATGIIRSADP